MWLKVLHCHVFVLILPIPEDNSVGSMRKPLLRVLVQVMNVVLTVFRTILWHVSVR